MTEKKTKTPIDVEVVPEHEAAMIDEVAALTVKLQEKRRSLQNGEVLRGVHPKSHGCVDATFTVNDDIGSDYRVGLFAHPAEYKAKIRYSNAAVILEADLRDGENGSRGMAIKVLGVHGPIMLMDGHGRTDGHGRNQDFLMVNTPEFAFGNVRDYLRLSRILMADEHGAKPDLFFVPAESFKMGIMDISGKLSPPGPEEPSQVTGMRQILKSALFKDFLPEDMAGTLLSAQAVQKIQSKTVRNPLEVQYFSASPFRYGPDRVMKFSAVPEGGEVPQEKFSDEEKNEWEQYPNYLAQALKKTLTQGKEVRLSFKVQIVEMSQLADRKEAMIENAAKAWSEEEFPFVEVAKIVIHPVEENAQLVDACKSLRFTPWHALAAHEPLGGINRLRKPVYSGSADRRGNA